MVGQTQSCQAEDHAVGRGRRTRRQPVKSARPAVAPYLGDILENLLEDQS